MQNLKLDRPSLSPFISRHIGPDDAQIKAMLEELGYKNLESFIKTVVPSSIFTSSPLNVGEGISETEVLEELAALAAKNKVAQSFIGMGYTNCLTPSVILRNIMENPGWYTQYTPYQAEISQGRLEALLNFQTMVSDLTGLPVSNASLLDEGTACAEALIMCKAINEKNPSRKFFISQACHPQTIAVVQTRLEALGLQGIVEDAHHFQFDEPYVGVLLQYPESNGELNDPREFISKAKQNGATVVLSGDLLSLALLTPPGELGADIAVGTAQRLGVPLGFGGPHAAYLACKEEFKRKMPGRIVGLSKDNLGNPAIRLALQTREQHIRRDRATSNICTAQVLLAVMASMYAVYHGAQGLIQIARDIHEKAKKLFVSLQDLSLPLSHHVFFDTLHLNLNPQDTSRVIEEASKQNVNFRVFEKGGVGITLDETTTSSHLETIVGIFSRALKKPQGGKTPSHFGIPSALVRQSSFLTHPVFNTHHSESEMLRYMFRLQAKDLSLTTSMIPLGSCTMKLNATTEMIPVTWPGFNQIHPFAPAEQTQGYRELFQRLENWLSDITGFEATSLQPNAGSQGEYAGLLVIRKYLEAKGQGQRNICLIPESAHGTNPASAVMAGFKVVVVKCDKRGNINLDDLKILAEKHAESLAALMVTYPSTHGVFEPGIREVCEVIHSHGGQVYMDGANMNAQVGLARPGEFGADVCHLNLHKTFCIPHGGGGPGMGPICVAKHLKPFLPSHPVIPCGGEKSLGTISAAPWGSASILPIPYAYIRMMGSQGLKRASQIAILNANYITKRLSSHYPVLYKGLTGLVAHECIIDLRHLKKTSGVEVEDVAKRLMDYGFHAPTVSFPVPGTLMIEPTESEPKEELDRFCEAMISIRKEISQIEEGTLSREDNPLKNAPHTAFMVSSDEWNHSYSRELASFPAPWLREHKYWPPVGRIDNAFGDRNLVCSCPPIGEYNES